MVKIRKKRKPMSEEQRKAAGERLAKARAKRQAANFEQMLKDTQNTETRGNI